MSVTGTGLIIMFIGFYSFFFNKNLLYDLTVFFIPFSATAVINIGDEGTGSAIQPFMFLGTLWLMHLIVSKMIRYNDDIIINKSEFKSVFFLCGFIIVAFFSLLIPIMIAGEEKGNVTGGLWLSEPIRFSSRNITQFVYLLFGAIFSIGIYLHNKKLGNYLHTLKIYSYAVLFTVLWGFVELFCFYKGLTFPAFLFNNSYNGNAGGYKFFTGASAELKRISSVGIEPSIMVQSVVVLLPFLIVGVIKKNYIFSKWKDTAFIILLYIFTIRTTSSSGIVCLAFLTFFCFIFYFRTLGIKGRIIFVGSSIVFIPTVLIVIYSIFKNIVNEMLFEKGESYSSLERLSSVIDGWNTFLIHPFFGTGWASVSSFDLFVKILSNTGIVGFLFFISYISKPFVDKFFSRPSSYVTSVLNTSILISFGTIIFGNMINTFSFIFGTFWLISGLAMINSYK